MVKEMKFRKVCQFNLCTLLLVLSWNVDAAIDNAGILNTVLNRFQEMTSAWGTVMVQYASWLFWGLALISMVWTFGIQALKNGDIQALLAEIVSYLAVTGFFFWILINGPYISIAIIHTMQEIGARAAGIDGKLYPSDIVDMGFDIFFRVLDQSSVWAPIDSACGMILSGVILVILALIGINMLLLLVSGWILAYAGIFLLGFGGGRWTTDIAINYYKTVIGVGVQLMTMILLVGIGKSFLDNYYVNLSAGVSLKEMAVMPIVLLVLTNKIPPMLAGIVGGGAMQGGIGGFGAGAVLGAAGMAASAAGTAGNAIMNGANSTIGGASALQAAYEHAQEAMSSDIGSGQSTGSNEASRGSFAEAMGRGSQFAGHMVSSLGNSAMEMAKEKAGSIKSSISGSIDNTTGGKIAANIRKENADSEFSENGFRADQSGTESADEGATNSDYADFVSGTRRDDA